MYDIGCDQHKHYCLMAAVDEQGKSFSEEKIYHCLSYFEEKRTLSVSTKKSEEARLDLCLLRRR